jgi:hypothetical protein
MFLEVLKANNLGNETSAITRQTRGVRPRSADSEELNRETRTIKQKSQQDAGVTGGGRGYTYAVLSLNG